MLPLPLLRNLQPALLSLFFLPYATADTLYIASSAYDDGELGISPFQNFTSSPLHPPAVNIVTGYSSSPSSISTDLTLIAYRGVEAAFGAPLILDNNGSTVWSGEIDWGNSMDLIVQEYQGQPVLSFFQGTFSSAGFGEGYWVVLDQSYNVLTTVSSLNQTANTSDFHEFILTPQNTALVESWRVESADLSPVGGPQEGFTWDCVFQEIDLSSGELLFEWRSLEHVPVSMTYFGFANPSVGNSSDNPFDYCHINSLDKDANGDYLVSLRGPSTLYLVNHTTSDIIWQIGGMNPSFSMGTNTSFWFQHHARFLTPDTSNPFRISVFDNADGGNGAQPGDPVARGIVLELDTSAMTYTLIQEYPAPFGQTAPSQGSTSVLSNGNVFIGWGAQPYYSEFSSSGDLLYEVHFASLNSTAQSYRAFKQAWVGRPLTNPDFALDGQGNAFASWNGATDVSTWALLGGNSTGSLQLMTSTSKSGFETTISAPTAVLFYAAAAIATNGTCLGTTEVWASANMSSTGVLASCPVGTSTTGSAGGSSSSSGVRSGVVGIGGLLIATFLASTLALA
ncbi:hypothetical protein DACRYDRAFT_112558 [Dacryopinax primogenitus]|uniref:ASST-domain-containing protein n=1 Tax=Dacryopinax primogenitus (strain DJM 731) TaxID=1858805 RepID=M5FPV9_DACPD|nr:uncharacterized protein DACRYDRAFT_112558 [Dacryopinax primogenitus]EJT96609.1 hypothetical protein DACRYDRAFT_112558 [Dacryopinax primogenitus]